MCINANLLKIKIKDVTIETEKCIDGKSAVERF